MGAVTEQAVWSGLGPDALLQHWNRVLQDAALCRLPYRIETNKWGHIEMTLPASPRHMELSVETVTARVRALLL
jgi:hypothetical protein